MPPSASASPPTQTTHWVPKRFSRLARPAPGSGGGGGSNEGGGGSDGGAGGLGGKPASAAPGKTIGTDTGLGVGSGGAGTGSATAGGSGSDGRTGERMISG